MRASPGMLSEGVTPDWLAGEPVWFSGSAGRDRRRPHALLVVHLLSHQTHHRGQVHADAHRRRANAPGGTDLMLIVWCRAAPPGAVTERQR